MTPSASYFISVLCVLAVAGCNGTGLQGGASKKEEKKEDTDEKPESFGQELDAGKIIHDEESEIADKPVEVSGAMLTCAKVQVPGDDGSSDRFGCVIEKNKEKISRDEFNADYTVTALPNREAAKGAVIEPADRISLWHVFISLPAGSSETHEVQAVVRWTKNGITNSQILKTVISRNGKLNALRFGMTSEFHIGDDDYKGSACIPRLNTVALLGPLLSIKFTVAANDTKTAFHVNGICGLDFDNVAQVRVLQGTTIIKTVPLMKASTDIVFGIGMLAAGTYTLELESFAMKEKAGDIDDFIIGDITVISDKLITGELPPPSVP